MSRGFRIFLFFAGCAALGWGLGGFLPAHRPKPLNRFVVLFTETRESKVFLGDAAIPQGPCNVLYTNNQPIIWICVPHLMLDLGPVELPAPVATPEPVVIG